MSAYHGSSSSDEEDIWDPSPHEEAAYGAESSDGKLEVSESEPQPSARKDILRHYVGAAVLLGLPTQ